MPRARYHNGGAGLSLVFAALSGPGIIIGSSAAVFGVMLAFVLEWPNAPILIFPLPVPVRAKWLVIFVAAMSLIAGITGAERGVAHLAHLGGFAAALLYLRATSLLRFARRHAPAGRTSAVLVHQSGAADGRVLPFGPPRRSGTDATTLAEVDRVLDKISASGLSSLSPDERRFLDDISRQFKQDN